MYNVNHLPRNTGRDIKHLLKGGQLIIKYG